MAMNLVLEAILQEAERSFSRYGSPKSTQESLGVLVEEFDELKDAIHENAADHIFREAVQVAAVAYALALTLHSGNVAFHDRSGLMPQKRT